MSTLSAQPYKGTRDYYPAEKRVQNYIFATWKKVAQRYGYEEYGAPLLEPLEIFTAKSGQELANEQTYAFTDRGGRMVAIRPEMTPTISRMVAARRQELGYPARLFSIANFMRYERPQRGREREFWQFNVDLFGAKGALADAEIIGLAYESLKAFGADESMFEIKVNSRTVINRMMSVYLGLDAVQAHMMTKLFDRKNKIPPAEFTQKATEIFGQEYAATGLARVAKLVGAKTIDELPSELRECEEVAEVQELFALLKATGIKNAVFDCTLMRGLDYYTGMVFEVMDMAPENNRSMFGGGRYDGLVGLFGAEPIPTVGMAPGLTPITLFLTTHNLLPELNSSTDASIIVLGGEAMNGALQLAQNLREEGINVEVDISERKLDKQIKAVLKKQISHIIFVGETELKENLYTLKNVANENEEKLSLERIVSRLADYRTKDSADELDQLLD